MNIDRTLAMICYFSVQTSFYALSLFRSSSSITIHRLLAKKATLYIDMYMIVDFASSFCNRLHKTSPIVLIAESRDRDRTGSNIVFKLILHPPHWNSARRNVQHLIYCTIILLFFPVADKLFVFLFS